MGEQRAELWVGATVLAALALFLYATFRVGGCAWVEVPGRRLVARFDDAAGVELRTEVTVAGVRVGEVESVRLDGGRARVTLRIEETGLELPVDSVARIRSRGLLGERQVEIVPGGSQQLLGDGDVLTRTVDAANVDRLLDQLAGVADDVKTVTRTLRLVLGGSEGEAHLAEIVQNVHAVSQELRGFVEDNRGQLAGAIASFDRFAAELARLTEENGQTLDQMLGRFARVSGEMETAVGRLAAVSERVERGEGSLGKLLNDEELYDSARDSLAELREALREVRRAAEDAQEQLPVTVLGSMVGTLF